MTNGISLGRGAAAAAAGGLLAAGALAAWTGLRLLGSTPAPAPPAARAPAAGGSIRAEAPPARVPDVAVVLSPEAMTRAGIVVAPAGRTAAVSSIRVPGVVAPNAYRQVTVTSLVAGRITRVPVVLGQVVRRGEAVATVQSPALAEAQAQVRAAEAMLEAHDRERARTEKLVALGAASRQELERIHAEHTAKVAELASARARLGVLGGAGAPQGDPAVTAGADLPAPLAGTVIERPANPGATVDAGAPLVTIADLSTIWIVGDVYERDVPRVRVGQAAVVTLRAEPGAPLAGRVAYIDPQVSPATRTARIRIELPNPGGRLRLGMYADVVLEADASGAGADAGASIPKAAIQAVGDRQVVYVVDPVTPGRFVERVVEVATTSGPDAFVTSGLAPGDRVVVAGSFAVRAEADRLGQRRPAGVETGPAAAGGAADGHRQTVEIKVTGHAFEPASVTVAAGRPVRLRFTRVTEQTCATEIVVPSAKVRRALPLDRPIDIDLPAQAKGELAFVCGMDMLKGTVVVR
jgi:cobalt-zinc-cadmium efflux system membrane fusion protein